jgi:hypothetical protein
MRAPVKRLRSDRFGEPAFERDEERFVVLVAVSIDQHEDASELRWNGVEPSADQLRVLQGDLRRQQGSRPPPSASIEYRLRRPERFETK